MRKLIIFGVVALVLAACATGFVARSQQTLSISLESVNAFLTIEKENQAAFEKLSPGVHAFAEQLRVKFPPAFKAATDAIDAYKAASILPSTNNVTVAVAVVNSFAQSAQAYLVKWGQK